VVVPLTERNREASFLIEHRAGRSFPRIVSTSTSKTRRVGHQCFNRCDRAAERRPMVERAPPCLPACPNLAPKTEQSPPPRAFWEGAMFQDHGLSRLEADMDRRSLNVMILAALILLGFVALRPYFEERFFPPPRHARSRRAATLRTPNVRR
jgi:hypothetical protein